MVLEMHNEAFQYLGLDYAYLAFEVGNDGLEDAVKGLKAMQARGCNVSMPNKTVIHKYLDKLTPAAELAGAVNTVINDDGVLTGHITDGVGYMRSLSDAGFDVIGKKMTIVGAGGAATAICIQAALDGVAELSIFNQDDEFFARAEETVKKINEKTNCKAKLFRLEDKEALRAEIADSAIFTNGTGMGMKPYVGQTYIEKDMLRPDLIVSDVVYQPAKTRLLELAEGVGCPTINGLGMMLFQGAEAFKCWTGEEMPIEHMKEFLFGARAEETVKKINEKTNCKAKLFRLEDKEALRAEIADSAIFTNGTGMGMKPYVGQTYIEKDMLRPDLIVSDVVYQPAKTRLLELAEGVGCPTINGLGMMLFQGAEAFKCWTGEEMPIEHMKEFLFGSNK